MSNQSSTMSDFQSESSTLGLHKMDFENMKITSIFSVLEKMQTALKCSICLDLLICPVTTKCGHSFCSLCVDRTFSQTKGSTSCPLCMTPMTKRSLQKNGKIINIVNAVRKIITSVEEDLGYQGKKNKNKHMDERSVIDITKEESTPIRRGTRKREPVVPFANETTPNKKINLAKTYTDPTVKCTSIPSKPSENGISVTENKKMKIDNQQKVTEWLDTSTCLETKAPFDDDKLEATQVFDIDSIKQNIPSCPTTSSTNELESKENSVNEFFNETSTGKENSESNFSSPKKKNIKRILVEVNDKITKNVDNIVNKEKIKGAEIRDDSTVIEQIGEINKRPISPVPKPHPNSKGHNIRFASELKCKLQENPKPSKFAVGKKTKKSPGWSHIESVKRDLRSKQTSLNIKGGEERSLNESSRADPSVVLEDCSQETVVVIEDQTQNEPEGNSGRFQKLKNFVSSFKGGKSYDMDGDQTLDKIKRRSKLMVPRTKKKKTSKEIVTDEEPLKEEFLTKPTSVEPQIENNSKKFEISPEKMTIFPSSDKTDLIIDNQKMPLVKKETVVNCTPLKIKHNKIEDEKMDHQKQNCVVSLNKEEISQQLQTPRDNNIASTICNSNVPFEAMGSFRSRYCSSQAQDSCLHTIPCHTFKMLMTFSKYMVQMYQPQGDCYASSKSSDQTQQEVTPQRINLSQATEIDPEEISSITKRKKKKTVNSSDIKNLTDALSFCEVPMETNQSGCSSTVPETCIPSVPMKEVLELPHKESKHLNNAFTISQNSLNSLISLEPTLSQCDQKLPDLNQFSQPDNIASSLNKKSSHEENEEIDLPDIELSQPLESSNKNNSICGERKYKRIRCEQSSDEDEMSPLKKPTKKCRVNVIVSQDAATPVTQDKPCANSEELRDFKRYDQNVWDYYKNQPDINLDSILNNESGSSTKDIKKSETLEMEEDCSDEEYIPGTEEVFRNAKRDETEAKKLKTGAVIDLVSQESSGVPSQMSPSTTKLLNKCMELSEMKEILDQQKTDKNVTASSLIGKDCCSSIFKSNSSKCNETIVQSLTEEVNELHKETAALSSIKKITRSMTTLKKMNPPKGKVASLPTVGARPPFDSDQESEELFHTMPNETKNDLARERSVTPPPAPLIVTCTGLSGSEIVKVRSFLDRFGPVGSILSTSWVDNVTHVVAKASEDGMAERTLKYLFGITFGVWIVSFHWIQQSLDQEKLLPEDPFEVIDCTGSEGPARARTMEQRNLFSECQFCLIPPFANMQESQIKALVEKCGGIVVKGPTNFNGKLKGLKLIMTDSETVEAERIVTNSPKKVVVAHDWIVECVGSFALVGLTNYVLGQPSDQVIKASGISEALLAETQDFL